MDPSKRGELEDFLTHEHAARVGAAVVDQPHAVAAFVDPASDLQHDELLALVGRVSDGWQLDNFRIDTSAVAIVDMKGEELLGLGHGVGRTLRGSPRSGGQSECKSTAQCNELRAV